MSEWLAAGALAIPVAILSHELGHGIIGTARGLKGGRISYASAGFSENTRFWAILQVQGREAARAVASPLDVGLMFAAGPIVSFLTPRMERGPPAFYKPHELTLQRLHAAGPPDRVPRPGRIRGVECHRCILPLSRRSARSLRR